MDLDPSAITDRLAPVAGLVSIVVPVFNERESIGALVHQIQAVAKSLSDQVEIVFVDDGSTDGSWQVIEKLAAADPCVSGVRFRRNFGKAAALAAGFQCASGEIIITMDADLQDDPAELPRFLQHVRSGIDIVSGYKQIRHDPWHKVFPSRVFNWMVSSVTGVCLHDHNCGYKAYRAAVTRELKLYGELHRYTPVLAAARGFRVGELIVAHRPRQFGKSKFGWTRFAKGFLDLLQVRFVTRYGRRPMHFFGTIALITFVFAMLGAGLMLVNLLVRWLIEPEWGINPYWQMLMFVAIVGCSLFGAQSMLTGFVAELLASRQQEEPYAIESETACKLQRMKSIEHNTISG